MSALDPRFPEVVLDLADSIRRCLIDTIGLSENEADAAARTITREFSDLYAGQQIYVPVGYALRISERDQELFDHFERGAPKDELIRRFEISNATFYKIVRRVRAIRTARAQLALFPE